MGASDLASIFWRFLVLSAVAVGGTNTVMPGLYHYVVDERGWISGRQFADMFALAQASPGPNMMWVSLVGLQAGGWAAALATTLAVMLPATAFSLLMVSMHARNPDARFAVALRRGLAPIAVGFVLSSGWILLRSASHDWQGYALSALTFLVVLRTRVNPLWLMAAGALAGIAGFT